MQQSLNLFVKLVTSHHIVHIHVWHSIDACLSEQLLPVLLLWWVVAFRLLLGLELEVVLGDSGEQGRHACVGLAQLLFVLRVLGLVVVYLSHAVYLGALVELSQLLDPVG